MNEILLSALTSTAILRNAFKGGKFTCNRFLINAYLYIFLSLLLVSISVNLFDKYQVPSLANINSPFRILILFFLMLGLLILVMSWPAKNLLSKHLIWLMWIGVMGYTLYPLFQIDESLFNLVKYQVLVVMAILTLFTFWKPHLISLSWGTTLFALLIGLIAVQLFSLVVPGLYTSKMHYIISYFSFLLFTFFMIYDTKRLMVKARQCVRADYINDSIGIVLDALNIFSDLFGMQRN